MINNATGSVMSRSNRTGGTGSIKSGGNNRSIKSGRSGKVSWAPQEQVREMSEDSESIYSDEEDEGSHEDEESSYESSMESSKESSKQTFNIAKKESNRVRIWRSVMALALLATAGIVIGTTHVFLMDNEENEFQSAFSQAALTISDSLRFNYDKMVDSMDSRSEAITSFALASNMEWPFVTVPHFEIRGIRARQETHSETFGFSPLVATNKKTEWEAYALQHQAWVLEGRGVDVENPSEVQFLPTTAIIPPNITYMDEENKTLTPYPVVVPENTPDTPFAVNWQISPVPALTYTINLNLRTSPIYRPLMQVVLDSGDHALSDFADFGEMYETILPDQTHQKLHEEVFSGTNDGKFFPARDRPHSVLMTPVFDTFSRVSRSVVGFVWAVLPWDWQMSDLLPEGTKLVHVVLDNSCGTSYTYALDGPGAILLGPGDLHETAFDDMVVTSEFTSQPIIMPVTDNSINNNNSTATAASTTTTTRQGTPSEENDGGAEVVDEEPAIVTLNSFQYQLCQYRVRIYPTKAMKAQFDSGRAEIFAIVMAALFLLVGMIFTIFVRFVQQRQEMVMATAIRTSAIVSSLFPANVRERIMKDAEEQGRMDMMGKKGGAWLRQTANENVGPKGTLEDLIGVTPGMPSNQGDDDGGILGEDGHDAFKSKPIADLFPDATVLFADLVGFTAWSSEREPTQVFQLLETLYHAYDTIARKRRVFKVETIGDCYVAVTGLPEPRKDHAVAMARFARDCLQKMKVLVVKLEVLLGPGTADLSMRFGLHSGPVTAGVLRGEKSRFQLFGDTVNTAARMESNGAREKIHVSQETADLIEAAKKGHWLTPREDKIHAKGKGELQTYWLEIKKGRSSSDNVSIDSGQSESSDEFSDFTEDATSAYDDEEGEIVLDERSQRLVDWTVDQLSRLLKQILARRELLGIELDPEVAERQVLDFSNGGTCVDEVKDLIELVPFDPRVAHLDDVVGTITLSEDVVSQLRDFVATIATLHNDNQFHNLSHATHVTMSVVKLLSRIIAVDDPRKNFGGENQEEEEEEELDQETLDRRLHERSYGLRSDPLAQFAVVFSALIHDVDHPGVTNAELMKENAKVAQTYNNKSISEQNSVDLAWYLFMDERYADLRGVIYHDEAELKRFRQIFVNAVIATDIADKDLKILRDARWNNAFSEGNAEEDQRLLNRKATVMIDCLLQASDIAHTMQHWHIYRKWNEFLYRELYVAYLGGRCEKNPAEFWYKGEIGFFDFYIIPLAKKLADCGVFGVSSDEYLNYAVKNRNEWEARGKLILEEYIENAKDLTAPEPGDSEDEDGSEAESYYDEEE